MQSADYVAPHHQLPNTVYLTVIDGTVKKFCIPETLLTLPLCTVGWFAKTQKHLVMVEKYKINSLFLNPNISNTPFNLQSTKKVGFHDGTHPPTQLTDIAD